MAEKGADEAPVIICWLELPIACARVTWGANLWLLTVMGLGAFMLTAGSLLALLFGVRWGW